MRMMLMMMLMTFLLHVIHTRLLLTLDLSDHRGWPFCNIIDDKVSHEDKQVTHNTQDAQQILDIQLT